jgi:hypothetical protein
MYFSACVDTGFSGCGFIKPPLIGWVERDIPYIEAFVKEVLSTLP